LGFDNWRGNKSFKSTNKYHFVNIVQAHVHGVRCLQVEGDTLVSGGADKIVFVWSIKEAQCLMILKGHEQGVYCLKFEVNLKQKIESFQGKEIVYWFW
jgi:WD40 repeat protein